MADNLSSRPTACFSLLPTELRRQIWLETFKPRVLSIVPHYGSTSIDRNHPASCLSFTKWHPFHICCLTFTVAIGLHPELNAVPYWAEPPFYSQLSSSFQHEYAHSRARPAGPVALHVCKESREIALQSYQLAFPGTSRLQENPEFSRLFAEGQFEEPKVWVDFQRDTIFIAHADEEMLDFRDVSGSLSYMEILARFASEDAKKIQKLAVAGHWSLQEPQYPHSELKKGLLGTLKSFEGTRELTLYHVDLDRHAAMYEDVWQGRYLDEEAARDLVVFRSDKSREEVRSEVVEALGERKRMDEGWVQGLPKVTVERSLQWGWNSEVGDIAWNFEGEFVGRGIPL